MWKLFCPYYYYNYNYNLKEKRMADNESTSRLVQASEYPKIVYLESLLIFFGANFLYHQNVFRQNKNKL